MCQTEKENKSILCGRFRPTLGDLPQGFRHSQHRSEPRHMGVRQAGPAALAASTSSWRPGGSHPRPPCLLVPGAPLTPQPGAVSASLAPSLSAPLSPSCRAALLAGSKS